ncbi:MAG: Proteasome-associated ATPase [Verrucomicrobiota bacterium]|jgi:proteasome-associated ATPase
MSENPMDENFTPQMSGEGEFAEPQGLVGKISRIVGQLEPGHPAREQLLDLCAELSEREDIMDEARETIEKLEAVVAKVTAPANRIGTFLTAFPRFENGRAVLLAQIMVGGQEYFCNVDPRIDLRALRRGTRVLVNEAFVVVGELGYDRAGPVVKISELLGGDRLRVGSGVGESNTVVYRSELLAKEKLKAGDEVRVDAGFRVALEAMARTKQNDYYLDTVPELPWEKVGGQREAISAIREAIEGPLLHPEIYERFHHATPKGFLLYGPPGCGKTLIGKATAWNLTQQLRAKTGEEMREFFMHIKGPEILNMWVGESERMVREIFATAREKRREGFLPFIFIDEAESILGTRRGGRHSSILSTLVPMFCTEMDGLESLHDAVIIIASNRADLIDPAILRPGRIDRKIKVARPTKEGAREIYGLYLTADLPYAPALLAAKGGPQGAADYLADTVIEAQFAHRDENRFLNITLRSGRREVLYRGDLVSGAIIASIVERAKGLAIRRALAGGKDEGISEDDLLFSLEAEYRENDIFPPSDITEDWLHLIDHDAENVVKLAPVRTGGESAGKAPPTVI